MPITIAEALRGGTVEVPTLNGTQADPGPGRDPARHDPAAARRGAAAARGPRPRRHPLPARDRGPEELSPEQQEAVEELAEAFNGPDPRAELLRDVGARRRQGGGDERSPGSAVARRVRRDGRDDDRRGARRLHDLGRRRARRDAPADAADVRGAGADRAEALAEEHPPLLAARRRAAAPDPADDHRGGLNLAGVETVLELERRVERDARRAGADAGQRPRSWSGEIGRGDRAGPALAEGRDRPLRRLRAASSRSRPRRCEIPIQRSRADGSN